ncbi:MAG: spondin domain-containing protein, partial [Rhodothermia bacterium]
DITDRLMIWDAGTEVNEAPGVGPNQAPRQSGPNTGPDEGGIVQLVDDGFMYPPAADFARVSIMPLETVSFTVRVENVSMGTTLTPSDGSMQAVPMAPGAFVVHTNGGPLFTSGDADRGYGLEDLAEDGNPAGLATALSGKLGYAAEAFAVPDGAAGPAPIGPGGSYVFTFDAAPGSKLSLATMFIPSNDLFYSPGEMGIPLWDENGVAVSGDVTEHLALWDSGTEINQEPGVGPDQAQR